MAKSEESSGIHPIAVRKLKYHKDILIGILDLIDEMPSAITSELLVLHAQVVIIAHQDTDLFVNMQPIETKARAIAAYEHAWDLVRIWLPRFARVIRSGKLLRQPELIQPKLSFVA